MQAEDDDVDVISGTPTPTAAINVNVGVARPVPAFGPWYKVWLSLAAFLTIADFAAAIAILTVSSVGECIAGVIVLLFAAVLAVATIGLRRFGPRCLLLFPSLHLGVLYSALFIVVLGRGHDDFARKVDKEGRRAYCFALCPMQLTFAFSLLIVDHANYTYWPYGLSITTSSLLLAQICLEEAFSTDVEAVDGITMTLYIVGRFFEHFIGVGVRVVLYSLCAAFLEGYVALVIFGLYLGCFAFILFTEKVSLKEAAVGAFFGLTIPELAHIKRQQVVLSIWVSGALCATVLGIWVALISGAGFKYNPDMRITRGQTLHWGPVILTVLSLVSQVAGMILKVFIEKAGKARRLEVTFLLCFDSLAAAFFVVMAVLFFVDASDRWTVIVDGVCDVEINQIRGFVECEGVPINVPLRRSNVFRCSDDANEFDSDGINVLGCLEMDIVLVEDTRPATRLPKGFPERFKRRLIVSPRGEYATKVASCFALKHDLCSTPLTETTTKATLETTTTTMTMTNSTSSALLWPFNTKQVSVPDLFHLSWGDDNFLYFGLESGTQMARVDVRSIQGCK